MKITGIDPGAITDVNTYKPPAVEEHHTEGGVKDTNPGTQKQRDKNPYSKEELDQAVKTLNNTMQEFHTELRFEMHEKSGEMMVKVVSREDGSVVREIPPEKVLDMVGYFKKILGIMVDKLI